MIYFENITIGLHFFFLIFLKYTSNFVSIECYLLFNPKIYFVCIILYYKNLKVKYLIDNIIINFDLLKNFQV